MNNRFQMYFFGGQKWKSCRQIKAHLMPKNRQRSASRSIAFLRTLGKQFFEQFEIIFHAVFLYAKTIKPAPIAIIGIDKICPIVTQSNAKYPNCASGNR